MKPFNLERALAGDPVVTRGGREVKDFHFFRSCTDEKSLIGVIATELRAWSITGVFSYEGDKGLLDLFIAPVQRGLWLNVDSNGFVKAFPLKGSADKFASPERIACVQVMYTEGEGL